MSATHAELAAVLTSTDFTQAEKRVLSFQFSLDKGGFFHALMDAIFHADVDNQSRLALGFPEEVAAVQSFQYGGAGGRPSLATRFRAAGVDL